MCKCIHMCVNVYMYVYVFKVSGFKRNVPRHQLLMLVETKTKNSWVKSNQQRIPKSHINNGFDLICNMFFFPWALANQTTSTEFGTTNAAEKSCSCFTSTWEWVLAFLVVLLRIRAVGARAEKGGRRPVGQKESPAFWFSLHWSFMTAIPHNE